MSDRHGFFRPEHPDMELVGGRFRLLQDLHYYDPSGVVYSARRGLVSDGASIPRLPVIALLLGHPWQRTHALAAIVHDQMAQDARRIGGHTGYRLREFADALYPQMILACGGSRLRAAVEGAGVALGRWGEWVAGGLRDTP